MGSLATPSPIDAIVDQVQDAILEGDVLGNHADERPFVGLAAAFVPVFGVIGSFSASFGSTQYRQLTLAACATGPGHRSGDQWPQTGTNERGAKQPQGVPLEHVPTWSCPHFLNVSRIDRDKRRVPAIRRAKELGIGHLPP